MRSYLLTAAALCACVATTTGCKKAPDYGLAVALTIDASALSAASRSGIRSFQINASGAETYAGTMALPNGIKATERTVYRPQASSGNLTIAITALEGGSTAVGYGTVSVALSAGKTVEATLVLTTSVPAQPDMAGDMPKPDLAPPPPDLAVPLDLVGSDFTPGPEDMAAPEDLTFVPDLRQVLDLSLPPGNHTGHFEALSGGAVGVGGTPSKTITLSVGGKLSGKAVGASHRVQFGAVRGSQP